MADDKMLPDEAALQRLIMWVDGVDLPMFIVIRRAGERLEFLHANAALGRVAGVPVSIFPGRSAEEIFPARMAIQLDGNYRNCLGSDAPVSYEECLMIEGRETWWQTTLSKPAGFHDRVILGIAVSTTDAKIREFAAAEAVADMTARFADLQLFSTMAAHDARSPLATVSSLVDLVLEDFEDRGDGKTDLLRMISNTVDEALRQITDTLEHSRSLKNGVTRRTVVDLGRLANDVAAMVDPEMTLEVDIDKACIECDAVVVQMGLRNLMTNAARFAGSRISVRLKADQARERVLLDVADDGAGLPEGMSLQDLIDQGEKRAGSHGFGLRSTAQLLRSRGGALELMPALWQEDLPGARFRMELPGRLLSDQGTAPYGGMEREADWAEAS